MAALPKAPNNYHPFRKTKEATIRRNWIIDQMAEIGYITGEQAESCQGQAAEGQHPPVRHADLSPPTIFAEEVRRTLVATLRRGRRFTAAPSDCIGDGAQRRPLGAHHARPQSAAHGAPGADRRPRRLRPREGLARPGAEDRRRRRLGCGARRGIEVPDDLAPWRLGVVLEAQKTKAVVGLRPAPAGRRQPRRRARGGRDPL